MMQMKKLRIIAIVLTVTLIFSNLYGCTSLQSQTPTSAGLKCGAGTALLGAAAGALADKENRLRGAIIGAVGGAVLGFTTCYFISDYQNRETKDYQETKSITKYQPNQGDVVKIKQLSIKPSAVSPGSKLAVNSEYYVMTPNPNQDIKVTETWAAYQGDKLIGSFPVQQTIKPGTRQANTEIPIGSDAQEGSYFLALAVSKDNLMDQKKTKYIVSTNPALANATLEQYFIASKVSGKGSLRSGPGKSYNSIGTISKGDRFPILELTRSGTGRNTATWYKIRLDDGREAWIQGNMGTVGE